jgi:hypothetical protein
MPAGITLEEIVITAVAAVCVFVAVLVFVLRMSARRQPGPRDPEKHTGHRDRRLAAGYGRPPDYQPPPLWADSPYDPPGWRP